MPGLLLVLKAAKHVGDLIKINLPFIAFIFRPPFLLKEGLTGKDIDSLEFLSLERKFEHCWRPYPDQSSVYDSHFVLSFLTAKAYETCGEFEGTDFAIPAPYAF